MRCAAPRGGSSTRKLWTAIAAVALALGLSSSSRAAVGPRPLSGGERAAVALAGLYFSDGAAAWWPHFAADSPWRALGQAAAVEELALRLGPIEGTTWRLETAREGNLAVFTIEYLSGFDETVQIEMVLEGKYLKIRDVRGRVDPQSGTSPSLAALRPLREALARGSGEDVDALLRQVPREPPVLRVARLWEAQHRLENLDAGAAAAALHLDEKEFPNSPLPLTALLGARLAFVEYDGLKAALAYEAAIENGVDYDGLRWESLASQAYLGFVDEAGFEALARTGSRLADVYYSMARTAVFHGDEAAVELFGTAWHLRPLERRDVFNSPLLARLCLEDDVHRWLALEDPHEPRVGPPEKGRMPLVFPSTVEVMVSGNHLTLLFEGEAEIEVPGGGVLAPEGTEWQDAGAELRRLESEALAELEQLVAAASSPTALAHPGLRRRLETAALALAERKRWSDLLRLTHGIAGEAEHSGTTLGRLRALALGKLGYEKEAIALLGRLARSVAESRDPGVLYQLAEIAVSHKRYDLAIRLIKKADTLSPIGGSSGRLWRIELDRQLARSHATYRSAHFTIRYPEVYADDYAKKIASLLEKERNRLKAWIPVSPGQHIEVAVFPSLDFGMVFGFGVLGLFDGKIRVPLDRNPGQKIERPDVLTHELVHALISDYAGEDVPSWFDEGLAQFLETSWPTENPLPRLHDEGRLLSIPMIEAVLTGYAPGELMARAYEESAWALRFLSSRFGRSGIRRLLDAFKNGQGGEPALTGALGLASADLHRKFWSWGRSGAARALVLEKEIPDQLPDARVGLAFDLGEVIAEHLGAMKEWYRGYSAKTRPVKKTLRVVLGALRGRASGKMSDMCFQLEKEIDALLAMDEVFDTPDGETGENLMLAYRHFRKLAYECRQGHWGLVQVELERAERQLALSAKMLAPYGLAP